MLKDNTRLELSEYINLYEKIIPKENILRKTKENIDFSFVNPMLKISYCERFGRPAIEPEMMLKLLFLKKLYDLSDEKLMENANTRTGCKYFLGLTPEGSAADASLPAKSRKTRITEGIPEEMPGETVRQAVEKGLINSRMIIAGAARSKPPAKHETPAQILRRLTKGLRKEPCHTQFETSGRFPEKPGEASDLSGEIEYSGKLPEAVKEAALQGGAKKAKNALLRAGEALENDKTRETQSSAGEDAKLGCKSEHNCFFGYKAHIAMAEERIITGLEVTAGEAPDGEYPERPVSRSEENGIIVEEITGDSAYSSKGNLEYAREREIKLTSKLNPVIPNGSGRAAAGFVYNKGAGMFQCPPGNLSVRKAAGGEKNNTDKNQVLAYYFGIEKCKACPYKGGCYKGGAKSKAYSVTVLSETRREQKEFQETEYFKERARRRYMIEAKNAEIKQSHGLEKAGSAGVIAMRLQGYFSAFVVNTKRIIKLTGIKAA
jgi:transposase